MRFLQSKLAKAKVPSDKDRAVAVKWPHVQRQQVHLPPIWDDLRLRSSSLHPESTVGVESQWRKLSWRVLGSSSVCGLNFKICKWEPVLTSTGIADNKSMAVCLPSSSVILCSALRQGWRRFKMITTRSRTIWILVSKLLRVETSSGQRKLISLNGFIPLVIPVLMCSLWIWRGKKKDDAVEDCSTRRSSVKEWHRWHPVCSAHTIVIMHLICILWKPLCGKHRLHLVLCHIKFKLFIPTQVPRAAV